jgi:integrase/recombinase XerD
MPTKRRRLTGAGAKEENKNLYLRDNVWWGYFRNAGVRHRRSLRTTDGAEAAKRLKAWRQEVEGHAFGVEGAKTYMEAVLRWHKEVLPKAVKPAVMTRYLVSIRQIDPHFANLRLDQISKKSIANMISARTAAGASNATIRRDLTALSRLLASCIAWGWLEENHARYFDRSIIREQKTTIRPPDPESYAKVLAAAPSGMAAILQLLDQTGMRENEAVTLEREDIDGLGRQIRLIHTKTNRPRTLNWATAAGDAGRVLMDLMNVKSYLFRTEAGDRYKNFSSNFGRVIRELMAREKKAGRPFRRFRVHDLRHGFAIRWLKGGGDIYRLSRHLGHTSVKTTEIYLGYLTDDEVDVIRSAGRLSTQQATAARTPTTDAGVAPAQGAPL